jgi:hypothetical protein
MINDFYHNICPYCVTQLDWLEILLEADLIIQIHSIPFSANQIFTVEAYILFGQILEDSMRVVDTLDNCCRDFPRKIEIISGSDSSPCSIYVI